MRRFALALLLLAACSSESDDEALPFAAAEHARGLTFLRKPDVVTRSRAAYADEVSKAVTDDDVTRYRTVWGRLGYVPTDFDLRAVSKLDAARIGAFYEPADGGRITRFDEADAPAYMVHELVHALQDQHFGLVALDDTAKSSDELLAVRALVEGDARVAEMRFRLELGGSDPVRDGPSFFTSLRAHDESEMFLSAEGIPAFLSAYASFCYSYGSIVVAKAIGLHESPPRWSTAESDRLFRGDAPRSTEAVLRTALDLEVDPIVEVGLTSLPEKVAEQWEIRDIDRLGAWLAWILIRETGDLRFELSLRWDGDQLVVIGSKDQTQPPAAVVWTSAWETEEIAASIVDDLQRKNAATTESMVVDRRGTTVVFAKGMLTFPETQMLANAALYERTSGPRPSVARRTVDAARFFDVHSTAMTTSSKRMRHGESPPSR